MNHTEEQAILENSGLAADLVKKFFKKGNFYSFQDLMQVANISILKAHRRYDPTRGCFSTLMYSCIVHDLIRFVNKHQRKYIDTNKLDRYTPADNIKLNLPSLTKDEESVVDLILNGNTRKDIVSTLNMTHHRYRTIILSLRRKLAEYV